MKVIEAVDRGTYKNMTGSELIFELRKFFGEGWKIDVKDRFEDLFNTVHDNPGTPVDFGRSSGREKIVITYLDMDNYRVSYII